MAPRSIAQSRSTNLWPLLIIFIVLAAGYTWMNPPTIHLSDAGSLEDPATAAARQQVEQAAREKAAQQWGVLPEDVEITASERTENPEVLENEWKDRWVVGAKGPHGQEDYVGVTRHLDRNGMVTTSSGEDSDKIWGEVFRQEEILRQHVSEDEALEFEDDMMREFLGGMTEKQIRDKWDNRIPKDVLDDFFSPPDIQ